MNDKDLKWEDTDTTTGKDWKPEEGDEIRGLYTGKKENVGMNNSNLYVIEVAGEEATGVWGSTVLDTKFEGIPVGSLVKIKYLGKTKGKNATYKDFSVQFVRPENM